MRKSLKLRLIRNLMLSLSAAWLLTILLGYVLAARTLNQQLDLQLKQVAISLADVGVNRETILEIKKTESFYSTDDETGGRGDAQKSAGKRLEKRVEFQIWRDDKMISYSAHAPRESLPGEEGYSQKEVGSHNWRVFTLRNGDSSVAVADDLKIRKALIRDLVLSGLWPMLIGWPLILVILWTSVNFGLRPLSILASLIEKRSSTQLNKIDLIDVPSEVEPVVVSLNRLFDVVSEALEREKQFADNAAHELRTPLAGIKAQTQRALHSVDEDERALSLAAVDRGIDRAAKIVSQLLVLARLEPQTLRTSFVPVDLNAIAVRVIAKLAPEAVNKRIEIGMSESDPAVILGNGDQLEIMISNLVDNAIRYSSSGGNVDVKIRKSPKMTELFIEDTGPGISEQDRQRVFNRFVRVGTPTAEGSGIGLAIVKKIAALHHARVELGTPLEHQGLVVRIVFEETLTRQS